MRTLLWMFALAAFVQPQQAPPRDAPAVKPAGGTAIIRGRITDKETGLPVARASVTAGSRVPGESAATVTGPDGRYEFAGLSAGDYFVVAGPGGLRATYLSQPYGSDKPAGMLVPRPLSLKDGEVRERIDIALSPALAIAGRVLDPMGEPLAGIEVTAVRIGTPYILGSSSTDDRGAFRVFGLPPGAFRLCATPGGSFAYFGPAATEPDGERYVRTCAPAAVTQAESTAVVIPSPRSLDVEIRQQRRGTHAVSGTVTDSTGAAAAFARVSVIPLDDGNHEATAVVTAGQFVANGLVPGRYVVRAGLPAPGAEGTRSPDRMEREVGLATIDVDAQDVSNVAIVTVPPATVAGQIVFDGEPAPAPSRLRMAVHAVSDETSRRTYPSRPPMASVQNDLGFSLAGLWGRNSLRLDGAPDGWVVKAIRYNGEEVTDTPVPFTSSTDRRALQIVLTNRVAVLSAHVVNDRKETVLDCLVMVIPANPARWKALTGPSFAQKPKGDTIEVGLFAPGEYLVAALDAFDFIAHSEEPDRVEKLSRVAQRITLKANEKRTIELQLVIGEGSR